MASDVIGRRAQTGGGWALSGGVSLRRGAAAASPRNMRNRQPGCRENGPGTDHEWPDGLRQASHGPLSKPRGKANMVHIENPGSCRKARLKAVDRNRIREESGRKNWPPVEFTRGVMLDRMDDPPERRPSG
jgi:hypothetical protein